ncbi:MAG: class I SAM-dependent methyltransferase [Spirochaetota bacterium]
MRKTIKTILRILKGFQTVLYQYNWGGQPYGFFIPHRYTSEIKKKKLQRVDWFYKNLSDKTYDFLKIVHSAVQYNQVFQSIYEQKNIEKNAPRFNQTWFTGLDAIITYTIIRQAKPKTIIEVGSGHSTRFIYKSLQDEKLNSELISIDPSPRKEIDKICTKIYREPVFNVDKEIFLNLQENDILFLDGSHIFMPGTDVDYLFNLIFPMIKKGVLIHIHDIFLPDRYPSEWNWRCYNEQNALLSLLVGGNHFKVYFPCHFIKKYHPESLKEIYYTTPEGGYESSFWLQKIF